MTRSKQVVYQKSAVEIVLKGVTPERFYRGSSSEPDWIPARSMRE